MKKISFLFMMFMLPVCLWAQPKKKQVKENPPSQAEMQQMMKEMQQQLNNMSPEEKKKMDEMGVKVPDMNTLKKQVSGISDQQLQQAYDDENRIVPQMDNARIALIAKAVTYSQLRSYAMAVHQKLVPLLDAASVKTGEDAYTYALKEKMSNEYRGNMAAALWAAGKQQEALFLMGKLCGDSLSDNNLNNYAAMLSMIGAEQLAVPVFENLLKKMPLNIILLNNLGQAWYGLGQTTKAEKYLDTVLALYPSHAEATFTKAAIEESKGHTDKAVDLLKISIRASYSEEKAHKLKKLGYKLKAKDIDFPFHDGYDPLALDSFKRPPYPKSVAEAKLLKPAWDEFYQTCDEGLMRLRKQLTEVSGNYQTKMGNIGTNYMQMLGGSGMPQLPMFAERAVLKSQRLEDDYLLLTKKMTEEMTACNNDLQVITAQRSHCRAEDDCNCFKSAENDYLNKYNSRKERTDEEILKRLAQWHGDVVYWSKYINVDPDQLALIRLQNLISLIEALSSSYYKPAFPDHYYQDCEEPAGVRTFRLKVFDLTNACQFKAKIDYGIFKQEFSCNYTTTTFDASFLKYLPFVVGMGVKYNQVSVGNTFHNSSLILTPKVNISTDFTPLPIAAGIVGEGTITINTNEYGQKDWNAVLKGGIELGVGKSLGPVKLKATIGESVEVAFSDKGLQDINLVTDLKAKAEIELPKLSEKDPGVKDAMSATEMGDFNGSLKSINNGIKLTDFTVKVGIEDRVSLMTGKSSTTPSIKYGKVNVTKW